MTRIVYVSVLFVVLVGTCFAGVIEVLNCTGFTNKVNDLKVEVSDCPSGNNCTLYKERTYYLTTTFTPILDIPVANMRALGVMGALKVPYMSHNIVCPEATTEDGENCDSEVGLVAGTTYSHVKDFPVRRMYPEMSMKARVEYFKGTRPHRRATFICYEVPVKIEPQPVDENEVEDSS